jgi:G3E family GTPase
MDEGRVLVNVITGFLGAGKTTLVLALLKGHVRSEKVAVIVNELGEISIDGAVIRTGNYTVKELSSGCICCEISGRFKESVEEILARYQPDRLLIEATGIAEPSKILSTFFSYESLVKRTTVEPTICVVDCSGFERLMSALAFHYVCQFKVSDVILLNKIDLVDRKTAESVRAAIAGINPRAWVLESERCQVPLNFLFMGTVEPSLREAQALEAHERENHTSEYSCFSYVKTDVTLSRERLERALRRLPKELFRLKGFVPLDDGRYLLNYVTGNYDFEPAPAAGDLRLVFVGRNLRKDRILAQIEKCRI